MHRGRYLKICGKHKLPLLAMNVFGRDVPKLEYTEFPGRLPFESEIPA